MGGLNPQVAAMAGMGGGQPQQKNNPMQQFAPSNQLNMDALVQ
jgi:hypothetical protein